MNHKTFFTLALVLIAALGIGVLRATSQTEGIPPERAPQATVGTAFTYQGHLNDGGSPANGSYDFEFSLYDAASGGTQIGSTVTVSALAVSNGLFTASLDFGSGAFDGDARFLAISVAQAGTGSYAALSPRQELTSAPYAQSLSPGVAIAGELTDTPVISVTNSADGRVYGIQSTVSSTNGHALYGVSQSNTGFTTGVYGVTNSSGGYGLYGLATSNFGTGVYGEANGVNSYAAYFRNRADGGAALLAESGNGGDAAVFQGDVSIDGYVGIGTTEPNNTLNVIGYARFDSAPNASVRIGIASDTSADISFLTEDQKLHGSGHKNGFNAIRYSQASGILSLRTNNADRISIEQGGDVGIGTTNPTAKLDVAGTAKVNVLEIDGGMDLAEPFVINDDNAIEAGTVVVLDPGNPGQLRVSDGAYDPLVAGIVSGAGGINPGLVMQQSDLQVDGGTHPIALTGQVYVKAVGKVAIGDLLTTSHLPGHAMTATDRDRAFGAVIGKAMSSQDGGTGLILVLVALQ